MLLYDAFDSMNTYIQISINEINELCGAHILMSRIGCGVLLCIVIAFYRLINCMLLRIVTYR